jgi:hypothetical protein
MGFLMNPGYVALNAMGIEGHGNYCRNDRKGSCLYPHLGSRLNQTPTIEALNDGAFMIMKR